MTYTLSGELGTDTVGFKKLMHVYHLALDYPGRNLNINFGSIRFFDANMSAVLLAVLEKLKKDNNNPVFVDFRQINENCEVLRRNGFTSVLQGKKNEFGDRRNSTVQLRTFRMNDVDGYVDYIEKDFLRHRGLDGLLTKTMVENLRLSYNEIFSNVELHAETDRPIYTCGQYYPGKQEFKFSLVDVGVGFLKKISCKDFSVTTSQQAIDWGMKGNSTKPGGTRGGTGLKTILKFCMKQRAEFHVVSGDCYWLFDGYRIDTTRLGKQFCGTTIHLVFRF